ncbi:MAG: hypothetical protein HZC37_01965 [Burkholderiales bacterium]|nr:hypothetical protein [Burkholderiales bacterium]
MTTHLLHSAVQRRRRRWALIALVALLAVAAGLYAALQGLRRAAPASGAAPEALAQTLDRRLQRGSQVPAGIAIRPLQSAAAAAPAPASSSASTSAAASASASAVASAPTPASRSAPRPAADVDAAELAESLCDALAARLVRGSGLRVVPCRSTRAAVAAALDDAGLARLLGVRYVLSGSVQALDAATVHVRLTLREVAPARVAWQFDEPLPTAQLQGLPARAAQAASRAIGLSDGAPEEAAIAEHAYLDYLRASQLARRPTVPDKQEAYRLNERVLAAAPDYEPALYLRLGLASMLSASRTGPATQGSLAQVEAAQQRLRDDIRALGQRMVARDPASWRGHILLLNDAFMHARWLEATEHADALSRHTARHPGVLRIAARLYFSAGYLRQAQALALDAARLNALDAEAYEVLALTHAALGEPEAFAETLALAVQMGHRRIGVPQALLALRRGDSAAFTAAAREFAESTAAPGGWAEPWVRGVLEPAARGAAAEALLGIDENERRMRAELLLEWVLLGDTERAAAALQAIAARPLARWAEDLWWPELAAVRQHPGFARAADRMGLAALWSARGAPDLCTAAGGNRWQCR